MERRYSESRTPASRYDQPMNKFNCNFTVGPNSSSSCPIERNRSSYYTDRCYSPGTSVDNPSTILQDKMRRRASNYDQS